MTQPPHLISSELHRVISENLAPSNVVLWLGSLCLRGPAGKPLKFASRRDADSLREVLQAGAEAVIDWPESFLTATARHIGMAHGPHRRQPNMALGKLVKQLRALPDVLWRDRVAAALRELSAGRTPLSKAFSSRSPAVGGSALAPREAARRLGISTVRARTLGAALRHDGRLESSGIRRARVALSEHDVEVLRESIQDAISTKAASRLLGLSPARVLKLLGDRDRLAVGTGDRWKRRSVEELAIELNSRSIGWSPPDEGRGWITVSIALQRYIDTSNTLDFFRALGEPSLLPLRHRAPMGKVGGLLVPLDCVLAWYRATRPCRSDMTIPEAALKLGLKQEVAYHLASTGLLEAVLVKASPHPVRKVSQASLRAFKATYTPLASLAKAQGVRARDSFEWAKAQGITVVTGPRVDGSRQYFAAVSR